MLEQIPTTREEADEMLYKLYEEIQPIADTISLKGKKEHEHYGPCAECEQTFDTLYSSWGIYELEALKKTLPSEADLDNEEW